MRATGHDRNDNPLLPVDSHKSWSKRARDTKTLPRTLTSFQRPDKLRKWISPCWSHESELAELPILPSHAMHLTAFEFATLFLLSSLIDFSIASAAIPITFGAVFFSPTPEQIARGQRNFSPRSRLSDSRKNVFFEKAAKIRSWGRTQSKKEKTQRAENHVIEPREAKFTWAASGSVEHLTDGMSRGPTSNESVSQGADWKINGF